jgi:hypothetical protein
VGWPVSSLARACRGARPPGEGGCPCVCVCVGCACWWLLSLHTFMHAPISTGLCLCCVWWCLAACLGASRRRPGVRVCVRGGPLSLPAVCVCVHHVPACLPAGAGAGEPSSSSQGLAPLCERLRRPAPACVCPRTGARAHPPPHPSISSSTSIDAAAAAPAALAFANARTLPAPCTPLQQQQHSGSGVTHGPVGRSRPRTALRWLQVAMP